MMKNEYRKAVDNIELNETEKARIYYRVRNAESESKKRSIKRRLGGILTAALAVVLVFTITLNSMPVAAALVEPEYPTAEALSVAPENDAYLTALRRFSYDTVAAVDRGMDGNTVYSPYSMSILLSMLAEMTDGETRQEILDLFGADSAQALSEDVGALYKTLYSDTGDYTCRSVQSVWVDNSVNYEISVLESLAQNQFAGSYKMPFSDNRALSAVSDWMKEEMGGSDMPQAFLETGNKLMLASGFQFRSEWKEDFRKEQMYTGVFSGTEVTGEVEYMNKVGTLAFLQTEEASAVQIALAEGSSVVFILPDEVLGLDAVLEDGELLEKIVTGTLQADRKEVAVSIPTTSFKEELNISAILGELGVTKVFDKYAADFSAFSADEGIYAGQIVSNTVMDLREEAEVEKGEEAYTAANMLTLDRPFAYVVVSAEQVPLMIGVVENAMQLEE